MKLTTLLISLVLSFSQVLGSRTGRDLKIVHGATSVRGQFPYQALLRGYSGNKIFTCGGALISRAYVLTAAHCTVNVWVFEVHLGAQNLSNYNEPGRQLHFSFKFTAHGNFDPVQLTNDIALVRLETTAVYTDLVRPVAVAKTTNQLVGMSAILSGWGLQSSTASGSVEQLQYAHLNVISNRECENYFYSSVIRSNVLCSMGARMESGCSGDSGGPLVAYTRILVGLASFVSSKGCDIGYPTGFTRVSSFVSWIQLYVDDLIVDESIPNSSIKSTIISYLVLVQSFVCICFIGR